MLVCYKALTWLVLHSQYKQVKPLHYKLPPKYVELKCLLPHFIILLKLLALALPQSIKKYFNVISPKFRTSYTSNSPTHGSSKSSISSNHPRAIIFSCRELHVRKSVNATDDGCHSVASMRHQLNRKVEQGNLSTQQATYQLYLNINALYGNLLHSKHTFV